MALIKCKECGAEISDAATACPKCGAPNVRRNVCPDCGASYPENAQMCPNCGAPNHSFDSIPNPQQPVGFSNVVNSQTPPMARPDSNLVGAIMVTIFCCLPLGIVALVKANKVSEYWDRGMYNEAKEASDSAFLWICLAIAFSIVWVILSFALGFWQGFWPAFINALG